MGNSNYDQLMKLFQVSKFFFFSSFGPIAFLFISPYLEFKFCHFLFYVSPVDSEVVCCKLTPLQSELYNHLIHENVSFTLI